MSGIQQSRVYVVDDEELIARAITIILNRKGYRATAFSDSLVARKACEQDPPDILIADVVMPGLNGVDLAVIAKRSKSNCHILLFSGQTTAAPPFLESAEKEGYRFQVHAKPIRPERLLEQLEILSVS